MEDSAEASFLSEERDSLTSIAGDALVEAQKKLSCDGMNLRIINSHGNSSSPGLMEAPPTELPFFSLPLLTSTACSSPISPSARTSTLAADSLIAPSQYLVSHENSHTVSPVHSFPSASPSNSSIVGLPTATASPIPVRRPRHKPGERRELLTRAVEDVLKLNISMRRAAQKYNLAKSSLCDFVRKNKISLPNLRFKPSVLEMSSSSGSRSCVTGFKRACPDDNELPVTPSSPSKLTCGIGRKHSFVHTDSALSTTASLPLIASVGCDIGYEQIVSSGFYDSTDSVDSCPHTAPYNAIPVSADVGCTQPRCIPHSVISGLPGRTSTLLSFSKPSRIESPWHNSAGLPTQVPLRSWSAHNTHNLTGAGLGSISGCLDRKFPFNSMHQLRQTVESHGLISESGSRPLSDGSFAPTSGPSRDGSDHSTHFGSANEINSHSGDTASRGHTAPPDSFGSRTSPVGFMPIAEPHALSDKLPALNYSSNSGCMFMGTSRDTSHNPRKDTFTSSSYCSRVDTNSSASFRSTALPADFSTHTYPPSSTYSASPVISCANGFNSIVGRNDNNLFLRTTDLRLPFTSSDPKPNSQPSLASSTDGPTFVPLSPTKPNTSSCTIPSLLIPPCSSLASILSADISSLQQTALATLLFQHSHNVGPTPTSLFRLPNLMGCPTNLSHSIHTAGADDVVGHATPLIPDFVPTQATIPAPSHLSTTRLSTGQPQTLPTVASVWNKLSGVLSAADLLQQLGLDEIQQFVYRQANSQFSSVHNPSPSVLASSLAAQLLPHLSSQSLNHSFRPLITSLLGSLNQKAQDPSSSTTRAVNLNPPVSSFDPSANGNLSPEEVTATFIINTAPNMNKPNPYTQGLVDFINKSPSPFHAVHAACGILTSSGFRELSESEPWKLRPMDCVFVKKNGSTILAAAVGGKFKPGNGLHLIGAHTDSPCLRLKPVCDRTKEGYVQLGVETYGGGLWYTWFDRELKVAGRAVMANSTGRLEEHLVHIDRPIACVPSLAIHLNREIKTQGFNPNSEQHLLPVLCTSLMDQLNTAEDGSTMDPVPPILDGSRLTATASCGKRRYPTGLLRAITDQLGIPYQVESLELELYLADYQPARIGGLHNEFIHAPRLDNLFNSYTSLSGLVASLPTLSEDTCLRVVCLYDHEEIGSTSTQGANSCHTMNILRRITNALAGGKSAFEGLSDEDSVTISDSHFEESLSKSFLLSADQSHAVHPSYHDRHEVNHKPQFHCGIVLKYNTNQRYATNALTAAAVREIARFAEVPVQEFTNRQDVQCGSTIGPLLSAQLGVPTADVGFAQLAMHSCRELCCTTSVGQAVRFYSAFFEHMPKLWPPC
ncbi:unnamed protein product [Dicrocoelium dendriticum]|nr:unnamed protein product [Dicrocoelium dendriticum]